ncbi:MAG: 2OG-Fe(II) oxygenase, partial [Desulfobacteraceae bacterium]|nr:2OG-Fe(II) oxygenase [Desulfobacteraceae bacterium]
MVKVLDSFGHAVSADVMLASKYFPAAAAAAGGSNSARDLAAAHEQAMKHALAHLPDDPNHSNGIPGSDLVWKPTMVYDTTRKCYTVDTSMRQSWTLCSAGSSDADSGASSSSSGGGDSSRIAVQLPDGVGAFVDAFLASPEVAAELAALQREGTATITPPGADADAAAAADTSTDATAAANAAAAADPTAAADATAAVPDTSQAACDKPAHVLCKVLAYGPGGHFQPHNDAMHAGRHVGTLVLCPPEQAHTGGQLVAAERAAALPSATSPDGWCVTFVPLNVVHTVQPVLSGVRVSMTLPVYSKASGTTSAGLSVSGGGAAAEPLVPTDVARFIKARTKRYATRREAVLQDFEKHIKIARSMNTRGQARLQAVEEALAGVDIPEKKNDDALSCCSAEVSTALKQAWTPERMLGI